MKSEKDLNYYKGYAQGYKDAINDLKGYNLPYVTWSTDYPNWAVGSPTTTTGSTVCIPPTLRPDWKDSVTPEDVARIFSYKGD